MSKKIDHWTTTETEGCVIIKGADFYERWRPWGHPQGFGVEGNRVYQGSVCGGAEPVLLNNLCAHGHGGAIDSIKRSIPERLRVAIHDYPHWSIELLQLAEIQPVAFLYLRKANPFLLAVLGRAVAQDTLVPVWHWAKMLHRDQRDIVEALGYPRSWVHLMRKVPVKLAGYGYIQMALTAFTRRSSRMLRHCKSLNLDRLLLVQNHNDVVLRCPSILRVVGDPDDPYWPEAATTATVVTEILYHRELQGLETWPWREVRDEAHLMSIHRSTLQTSVEKGFFHVVPYPPPPISPCAQWRWISDSDELSEHAERFRNCALSYHWRLESGLTFLYESRERGPNALVAVVEKIGGSWQLTEIFGVENAEVDDWAKSQAQDHFSLLEGGENE